MITSSRGGPVRSWVAPHRLFGFQLTRSDPNPLHLIEAHLVTPAIVSCVVRVEAWFAKAIDRIQFRHEDVVPFAAADDAQNAANSR
jgi:hypothetical protein